MCAFWRPFADSDDDKYFSKSFVDQSNQNQRRFRIGEKEIIMDSYLSNGDHWNKILRDIHQKIHKIPMVNDELVNFYLKEDGNKVLRRVKRIVGEEMKVQALIFQKTQNSNANAQREPHRPENTFSGPQEERVFEDYKAGPLVEKQMRYATKYTPEQRGKRKLSLFVDTDESDDEKEQHELTYKKNKLAIQEIDSDNATDEVKTSKTKNSKKTMREVNYEAQMAHKNMCEKASCSLSLMNVLKKLDKMLDDM